MSDKVKLSRRIEGLDGLRAIAVLGVIVTHVNDAWLPGGQLGVDLFFALSGYLITHLLLEEHRRFGAVSLRAFYLRRFLRLTPALVVFALITTALSLWLGDPHAWGALAATLTYTMNFAMAFEVFGRGSYLGHAWSLAVEEQFYLLWPLLLTIVLARRPTVLLPLTLMLIALGLALTFAFQKMGMDIWRLYFLPTTRIAPLLVGATGAIVHQRGLPAWPARMATQPVLAAGALALMGAWMFHNTWMDRWTWRAGLAVFASLAVFVIVHVTEAPRSPVARALSAPPLVWIGRRSYGIYLWHSPVLWMLAVRVSDLWIQLAITLVVTAAVAEMSWRWIERPALRWKARFERAALSTTSAA